MSDRSRVLRGTGRASVGLAITLVTVGAVVTLGNVQLPTIEQPPALVEVDSTQDSSVRLACAGSFTLLGTDERNPQRAIAVGEPKITVSGDAESTTELSRDEKGGKRPQVFSAPADQLLAAAQTQSVDEEGGRGVAASVCAEPLNEQWLLGGDTRLGSNMTLNLGNPSDVAATVNVAVFDENGRLAESDSTAVRVAPQSSSTISVNGYAPDRERIAVQVSSTGAPVTATMGVAYAVGLDPLSVSTITRQPEPARTLVIPGVTNVDDPDHQSQHGEQRDGHEVLVRVFAPDGEKGEAKIEAVDADGKRTSLGTAELKADAVSEVGVKNWPKDANAVVVEADVPVIAGVRGVSDDGEREDAGWFTPAPELEAERPAPVAVVHGGRLIVANNGTEAADVTVGKAGSEDAKTVSIKAGAAAVVDAPENAVLTSTVPVYAGVRYLGSGDIDGYPVLAESQRAGNLLAYVR